MPNRSHNINYNINYNRNRYGFFNFLFDAFMTVITGTLWLIWVFVREMRRARR